VFKGRGKLYVGMYLIYVAMDYLRYGMLCVVYQQDAIDISSVEGNVLCV